MDALIIIIYINLLEMCQEESWRQKQKNLSCFQNKFTEDLNKW